MPWQWAYQPKGKERPPRRRGPGRRTSNRRRSARNVYLRIRHARLAFMWTLTYDPKIAGPEGRATRAEVQVDMRRFYERIQGRYGPMRLVHIIERGRRHGRFHAHLAVGRFLSLEVVKTIWGLGNVFVGDPGKLPGNPGAARLSRYMSKYVTKDLELDELGPGEHSYGCTQGWSVPVWRRRFWSEGEALAWLRRVMGEPSYMHRFGQGAGVVGRGLVVYFGDKDLWPPWDELEACGAEWNGRLRRAA